MSLKLEPSLIEVNGAYIENYQRDSRATGEVKESFGFEQDAVIKASMGIASVEEYALMFVANLPKGKRAVFDLSQFEQPMKVESVFIDSPEADRFDFEIYNPDFGLIFSLVLQRNKTPYQFPVAPLPNHLTIKVKALADITYLQLVLKPTVILASVPGTIED